MPFELIERLQRRANGRVSPDAVLEAAKHLGVAPEEWGRFDNVGGESLWNAAIDALDRNHPGWRGYPVPQTEGQRDA